MNKLFLVLILSGCCKFVFADISNINAKSYIVTELDGTVILEHDSKISRPIASITKLLVSEQLAPQMNLHQSVTIKAEDLASNSSSVKINSKWTQAELLRLALISSNNQAIYALTRANGYTKIISSVNETAHERGLDTISIEEPSGLSKNNTASAYDLAIFVSKVYGTDIAQVSTQPATTIKRVNFKSTNPLLGKPGWNFDVSKTGFTNPAGGCLVTLVEIGGRKVIVVILGSANVYTRWTDLIKIRSYLSNDIFWTYEQQIKRKSQ